MALTGSECAWRQLLVGTVVRVNPQPNMRLPSVHAVAFKLCSTRAAGVLRCKGGPLGASYSPRSVFRA